MEIASQVKNAVDNC